MLAARRSRLITANAIWLVIAIVTVVITVLAWSVRPGTGGGAAATTAPGHAIASVDAGPPWT